MPNKEIKVLANELHDVKVKRISLVEHGANQIPFKILKSEEAPQHSHMEESSMINLVEKFFAVTGDTTPKVEAVLVAKDAYTEALQSELKEKGFSFGHVDEGENQVTLKSSKKVSLDTLTYFKTGGDLIYGVSNVQKAFDPFGQSGSFSESIKKNGFLPTLNIATEVLKENIFQVVISADKSQEMVKGLRANLDEFSSFIIETAKNVPADAFKLEDLKALTAPVEETAKEEDPVEKKDEVTDSADGESKDVDKGEAGAPASGVDALLPVGAEDPNFKMGDLFKTQTEQLADLLKSVKTELTDNISSLRSDVDTQIKSMADQITAIKESTKAVIEKTDEAARNADIARKAVKDTVVSNSLGIREVGTMENKVPKSKQERKDTTVQSDEFWGGAINLGQFDLNG